MTGIRSQHEAPIRRAYARLTESGAAAEKALSVIAVQTPYTITQIRKLVGVLSTGPRVVEERRVRSTGTTVQLVDRGSEETDDRWETICTDHGGVCSHETRALAEGWLAHPEEWCEDCMYGPGTLHPHDLEGGQQ